MKKRTILSFFLAAALLVNGLCLPVSATLEDMLQTVPMTEETLPTEINGTEGTAEITGIGEVDPSITSSAAQLPFGRASIQLGCRTIDGLKPLAGSDRRLPTAQAAFAYEVSSGTVIYAYNPDTKLASGTLSKIVTAMVAIESCELDDIVTCSSGIQSKVPGRSIKVNLKSEEQISVNDLLHCLLMHSANDAAVALAEHVSGTTTAYLEKMNAWAKNIGCTNTEFGNISGLDTAVSYTTARDMARIMAKACENETFVAISGTTEYTVPATNVAEERDLITTNYMISNRIIPQFLDDRIKAGLPSTTAASGSSIAVMAEYKSMKLICVVMGAVRTYEDPIKESGVISYGNFNEMQDLMDYLYTGFKVNTILYNGQALNQFSVIGGESDVVGQPHVNYNTVLPVDCTMDNLIMEYTAVQGSYTAPIKKGDMIATVAIKYRNSYVAEAEIYAMNNVVKQDESNVTVRSTAVRAQSDGEGILGFLGSMAVLAAGVFGLYLAYNAYRRARIRVQRRRRRASRRRSY